ncbi:MULTISPECIES: hypothetical protein [Rhodanobacter]|jgi:hypothetical protein|uniref:Nuclear transport factor 2 family protein n=1 Tax=Rhodanobacter glycinis TaxID=582702 RepID=A0A1I4ATD4_9GAMM|nr:MULTISPECIES: hypothetical protein [Rhodanobacter]QEE23523.1 hypothetical protein CS053_02625 [Rhodanobacter glycinis]SFK59792.1 hypothetical protein SAMN05192579_104130 [Rhodanobacter glycinis]
MQLAHASDAEIMAVVEPIMDNLMDASTAIDYPRHIRDFTARLKGMLSEDALRSICVDYQARRGFFAGREFVALFRRPDSIAVVWRQRFTKAAGDFVAELVLVEQDGAYRVDHVMVF